MGSEEETSQTRIARGGMCNCVGELFCGQIGLTGYGPCERNKKHRGIWRGMKVKENSEGRKRVGQ